MILCDSYCSHGGRCTKNPRHEGDHDSDYCTWTDAEALTHEQADAVLATKAGGQEYLDNLQPFADLLDNMYDE